LDYDREEEQSIFREAQAGQRWKKKQFGEDMLTLAVPDHGSSEGFFMPLTGNAYFPAACHTLLVQQATWPHTEVQKGKIEEYWS